MKKILLTSAGLQTDRLTEVFHSLFDKKPDEIKALFIPTAANFPDAVSMLKACMDGLLWAGILKENIKVFDLHRNMETDELSNYDVVYFTGGSPQYLLERINNTGFNKSITKYVNNGGVYVGISAGSMVAANNLPDSLKFINCTLDVHTAIGTKAGNIDVSENSHINLKDNNAILILGAQVEIIE